MREAPLGSADGQRQITFAYIGSVRAHT